MALLSRFFGRTASEGAAYAFGLATGPVLSPATETIRQEAWSVYQSRIPAVGVLAEGVAQGKVDATTAGEWATKQGYNATAFGTLVDVARLGPGSGFAFELWRRNLIGDGDFREALERLGIESKWITDIMKLKAAILTPGELAAAIHRGLVPNPDILLGEQPSGPRNVASYPVQPIDAVAEAQSSGYDKERLAVLVGLQGLPMGTHEAAEAYFRNIITHGDYIAAFNESNSRNEWAEAVLEYTRQIPTARDYIENALRGYRTFAQAAEGAARHGMTEADARLIFQNSGRPLNLHQITQALAWGAKYDPQPGDDPDPYMNSVLIGSVTPAYYEMQDALKYNLPSAFYFRTLQQTGVLREAEAATWYKRLGWPPDLADQVAKAYATSTTTAPDADVKTERGRLKTTTHSSYIAGEITKTQARNALGVAGVASASITEILGIWDAEKGLVRSQMTAANIKRAFNKGGKNNATGKAWTRDEAVAALVELGWATLQANDYLDIP